MPCHCGPCPTLIGKTNLVLFLINFSRRLLYFQCLFFSRNRKRSASVVIAAGNNLIATWPQISIECFLFAKQYLRGRSYFPLLARSWMPYALQRRVRHWPSTSWSRTTTGNGCGKANKRAAIWQAEGEKNKKIFRGNSGQSKGLREGWRRQVDERKIPRELRLAFEGIETPSRSKTEVELTERRVDSCRMFVSNF